VAATAAPAEGPETSGGCGRGVVAVSDWYDEAHRVFKQVKGGIKDASTLTPREFGLLYLYFPSMLPDVEEEKRDD
jgi:hypothetical protein